MKSLKKGIISRIMHRVIDGDEHDWRFSEYDEFGEPVIIGLRAKGKAKKDTSGFVVDAENRKIV